MDISQIMNKTKSYFVERLWPYIQFNDHREYLTEDKDINLEGLYLDHEKGVWKPQTLDHLLKAIDVQIEFSNTIRLINEATQAFNTEALSKEYAKGSLWNKLEGTIQ